MRAQFIVSEIGIGLRRNLTMTVAVILSVAISLSLLGAGLLMWRQADVMKGFWFDKIEVSIFLCGKNDTQVPSCTGAVSTEQRDSIRAELTSGALKPYVKEIFYESKEEAYQRFKEQFRDRDELVSNVTAEQIPEAFRVKLNDPNQFEIVSSAFTGRPGVHSVQDQKELLGRFLKMLAGFRNAAIVVAVAMLVVAMLLILNTIRLAAFSRRRETGIMRLVGASSLYIQLPFLLEGAIAGMIGASLASGALMAIKRFFVEKVLQENFKFTAFVGWDAVWSTVPLLLGVGVGMSVLASFFTLRKYLRV
jgi:cell division transport system permease protein